MFLIDPVLVKVALFCSTAYTVVAFMGYITNLGERQRMIGVALGVAVSLLIVWLLNPFGSLQSFGPSPIILILLMIISIVLGSVAEFIFSLGNKKIRWRELIKPILISPLLLFPLIGLLQKAESLDTLASISLMLVAFQNGFFWRQMVEKLKGAL